MSGQLQSPGGVRWSLMSRASDMEQVELESNREESQGRWIILINLQEVLKISPFTKLTSKLLTKQGNIPPKAVELFQMLEPRNLGVFLTFCAVRHRFKFWISAVQLSVGVVLTSGTNTSPGVFGQSVLWVLQGRWVSLWAPPGIRDTTPGKTTSRTRRQTHLSLFYSKTQHQFNLRLPSTVHSSAAINMLN